MIANPVSVAHALNGVEAAFAQWSGTYDAQVNPLLTIEERYLKRVLPDMCGLDVLDVGCGTGRWIRYVSTLHPRSLTGIDPSPEMLALAARKAGCDANLIPGRAEELPVPGSSADVVLYSFVISYADPALLVQELGRVARPGARVFVTDVHPGTARELGWHRAFRKGDTAVELPARNWPIEHLASLFEDVGMRLILKIEPPFGEQERQEFKIAGKECAFRAAEGLPAIYILGFEKPELVSTTELEAATADLALSSCTVALGPSEAIPASLTIHHGKFQSISSDLHGSPNLTTDIDLAGYTVFPGLINAHDHLEFALFPRLGNGPYRNAEEWAHDIQSRDAALIRRHRKVAKQTRLLWGALRNLLCGVTTVCHHNPVVPELLEDNYPVRVLGGVRWAHSLAFDRDGVLRAIQDRSMSPFVLHLGEGTDKQSANEIYELERTYGLDERTVIVHGLALGARSLDLLNQRGAALVWCPSSNTFLFGRTHTEHFVSAVSRLALGNDSSLTAIGDLLDEIRFACDHVGVLPDQIYERVTTKPADVFALHEGQGTIKPSGNADLFAVRDTGRLPAETLAQASFRDVEMVIVGGKVQLASDEIMQRLPVQLRSDLRPLEVEGELRWVRLPLGRMFADAVRELGCDIRVGGKRVRHVCTAWL